MIRAERTDVIHRRYTITQDDRELTTVTLGRRHGAGTAFDLDGASYTVRPHSFGNSYDLLGPDRARAATADGVRGRLWTVQTVERTLQFRRSSRWAREHSLLDAAGRPAGTLTRTGRWSSGAVADLPGVPVREQVFAITVLLVAQQRRRTRTAVAVGAGAGG